MEIQWDGWDECYFGFNKLDRDSDAHGRDYEWVLWAGPFSIRKKRSV